MEGFFFLIIPFKRQASFKDIENDVFIFYRVCISHRTCLVMHFSIYGHKRSQDVKIVLLALVIHSDII